MVADRFVYYPKVETTRGTFEGVLDREMGKFAPSLTKNFVAGFNRGPKTAETWAWWEDDLFTYPEGESKPNPKPHEFTPTDIQPHIVVKVIEPDGSYAFGHLEAVVSIAGEKMQQYKLVGGVTVPLKEGSIIERWDFS